MRLLAYAPKGARAFSENTNKMLEQKNMPLMFRNKHKCCCFHLKLVEGREGQINLLYILHPCIYKSSLNNRLQNPLSIRDLFIPSVTLPGNGSFNRIRYFSQQIRSPPSGKYSKIVLIKNIVCIVGRAARRLTTLAYTPICPKISQCLFELWWRRCSQSSTCSVTVGPGLHPRSNLVAMWLKTWMLTCSNSLKQVRLFRFGSWNTFFHSIVWPFDKFTFQCIINNFEALSLTQ